MKTRLLLSLTIILVVLNGYAQSQRTCGTMENLQEMTAKDPAMIKNMEEIEKFTADWVKQHALQKSAKTAAIITIPVIIHIIHNGEAIGSGANISYNQAMSQIIALNEDFRLLNEDSLQPSHPFWPYTADTQIQFCLAQRTPSGASTTGIERINGGQASWTKAQIESTLKPSTIWNRDKYLNLWSLNFGGADAGLLGYAQFPGGNASTDGVVIRYTAFGYVDNVVAPYNNGRTGVHEVGHWLNLRHIWGDNQPNCGDDLVGDTKPADAPNFNCPGFPKDPNNTCGGDGNGEMYMNYMDYVDDNCMVMFTFGQASRMQAILNGTRSSLKTSLGCATVGVDELTFTSSIDLFPNPNNGSFTINSQNIKPEKLSVEIYDLIGSNIQKYENINSFPYHIDVSHFANGLYYVKIINETNSTTKKILISK